MTDQLVLFSAGLAAGSLGGMLGLGGGIVLMPVLRFGLGLPPALAAGTCVVAVFFTTAGGSYRFHRLGMVRLRPLFPVLVAGMCTTALFSWAFASLAVRERWLDLSIGLVFCGVSALSIRDGLRPSPQSDSAGAVAPTPDSPVPARVAIGSAAGVFPGLLGIGTGGILVPAFAYLLRWPIKQAMAASLVCFCINAAVSASFKWTQGFVVVPIVLAICLGTFVGANLGAELNRRLAPHRLKVVFGLLFSYVALKFVLSSFEIRI